MIPASINLGRFVRCHSSSSWVYSTGFATFGMASLYIGILCSIKSVLGMGSSVADAAVSVLLRSGAIVSCFRNGGL